MENRKEFWGCKSCSNCSYEYYCIGDEEMLCSSWKPDADTQKIIESSTQGGGR